MSYLSLDLNAKQSQKQTQRLMMTPQMQQAITLLQLPIMELSTLIDAELEQNPVLEINPEEEGSPIETETEERSPEKEIEFDEHQFEILKQLDEEFRDYFAESGQFVPRRSAEEEKLKSFLENSIEERPSLFEHLMQQAREVFQTEEERKIAELIFGYLDENGLLKSTLGEIAKYFGLKEEKIAEVLRVVQTFDPVGIASQNVRDVLLAQLRQKGKTSSLSYQIIDLHFDDLLHNRLPVIQKDLKVPMNEIRDAIQNEISHLNLHPGTSYSSAEAPSLIPDVRLKQEGEEIFIEVNDDEMRPLRLNRKYMKLLDDESLTKEAKDFIKTKIVSAKWLIKNIHQRNDTLQRIASSIAKKQKDFFLNPDGKLVPWTMKSLAEELELHESTIARAVVNKCLETPRGLLPFRYFFSNAYTDQKGKDISSKTVRDLIVGLIEKEEKRKPLSDEAISKKIREQGIECARRTVAKYRGELNIGNTQQRREY